MTSQITPEQQIAVLQDEVNALRSTRESQSVHIGALKNQLSATIQRIQQLEAQIPQPPKKAAKDKAKK